MESFAIVHKLNWKFMKIVAVMEYKGKSLEDI